MSVTGSETVLIISEPIGVVASAFIIFPGDTLPEDSLPTACAVTATFDAESIELNVLGIIFAKPLKLKFWNAAPNLSTKDVEPCATLPIAPACKKSGAPAVEITSVAPNIAWGISSCPAVLVAVSVIPSAMTLLPVTSETPKLDKNPPLVAFWNAPTPNPSAVLPTLNNVPAIPNPLASAIGTSFVYAPSLVSLFPWIKLGIPSLFTSGSFSLNG